MAAVADVANSFRKGLLKLIMGDGCGFCSDRDGVSSSAVFVRLLLLVLLLDLDQVTVPARKKASRAAEAGNAAGTDWAACTSRLQERDERPWFWRSMVVTGPLLCESMWFNCWLLSV